MPRGAHRANRLPRRPFFCTSPPPHLLLTRCAPAAPPTGMKIKLQSDQPTPQPPTTTRCACSRARAQLDLTPAHATEGLHSPSPVLECSAFPYRILYSIVACLVPELPACARVAGVRGGEAAFRRALGAPDHHRPGRRRCRQLCAPRSQQQPPRAVRQRRAAAAAAAAADAGGADVDAAAVGALGLGQQPTGAQPCSVGGQRADRARRQPQQQQQQRRQATTAAAASAARGGRCGR